MALPLAAASLLGAFHTVVDAFWLGKIGDIALAAPAVNVPLVHLAVLAASALGVAGMAVVSQLTGAGREREAARASGQTLALALGVGVALAAIGVVFAGKLLTLTRVPGAVQPGAVLYLRIVMLGLPAVSLSLAYGAVLRGRGNTTIMLAIQGAANVVNLVLDPILIFGLFGAPRLEVKGAALATLLAQVSGGLLCLYCIRKRRMGLDLGWKELRPNWRAMRGIVHIALPLAVGGVATAIGAVVVQTMVNNLGTTVIGAVIIGDRVIWFVSLPMGAIATATAPIVGQALGAGQVQLARRAVRTGAVLVAAIMLLPMVLLTFTGHIVARAFISAPDVVRECRTMFALLPSAAYIFGVAMAFMSAFHGSGRTRPVMVASLMRVWLFRFPAIYCLAYVAGWHSTGIYAGAVVGNALYGVVVAWLYVKHGWQRPSSAAIGGAT